MAVSCGSSRVPRPLRSRGEDAYYPKVSLLYGLKLRKFDPRSVELNLVALAFRVEQEFALAEPAGVLTIKRSSYFIAISLELKRELLQGLTIDFGLGQPHRSVSHGVQLRSMH